MAQKFKTSVSVTQRGKNSFRLRVRYKDRETDTVQEQYFTVRGTREYAEAQKRLLLDSFGSGKMERMPTDTVRGYFSRWIKHRAVIGKIRNTTAVTYEKMLAGFLDRFGDISLIALKVDAVRSWVMDNTLAKGPDATIYTAKVVKAALASAVKEGIIPFNVFDRIELPSKAPNKPKTTIPPEKLKALWELAERLPTQKHIMVKLALETGMRRGELAGLTWGDFDDDCTKVVVRRTAVVVKRKVTVNAPKTSSSDRQISLSLPLAFLLRKVRGEPDHYLFGYEDEPPHPESISRTLRRALKDVGLSNLSAHDFRHAHATHLLRNKIPVASVAKRLGHSKITTTLEIYAHAVEEDDNKIIGVVDNILR